MKNNAGEKKIPCKFFNSGNGYCKFGDNCRHSHEGKKGGKRKPALLLSRKDKKVKKEIAAMVINEQKKKGEERVKCFSREREGRRLSLRLGARRKTYDDGAAKRRRGKLYSKEESHHDDFLWIGGRVHPEKTE